ncbi:ROK family protein [Klugiella xanthotipulae]|uniref:Putative NBD/HSP70 family sugar kinase n=1 Tax=Klugiella xanthotipulae TaxID=244735 RepID=A0A543I534_9MICO|nr:ROK family protein [Klugiella xanthotipulae]TQM65687.1 putative NBD/HSP70 family sugar kinase [Klugiella xanthotipulae]
MRIGIDIGGTKTAAVVLDPGDGVLCAVTHPTGYGPAEVLATALRCVTELAEGVGCAPGDFRSIGIGIPGAVNTATGRVDHAVNLGLVGFDLGAELAHRIGAPVRVENDVNAAALGAYRWVRGAETEPGTPGSIAYLNLGTGLAAGIILDGELWRGSRGVAGEIGHIPVDPAGALCPCGQRGCLETISSGSGIVRQWPVPDGESAVRSLMVAATAGNSAAVGVRDGLFVGVATAIRLLFLSVDVQRVVLGGGVTTMGEPLLSGVHGVLREWAARSAFLGSLRLDERIQILPDTFPAAAIGAALIGENSWQK